MGADVPLDRSKDSRACFLLHAGNFLVAIHLQEGADRLGWTVDGTAARATRSNRTVRPALSASGRKSAQPGGPGSLERDASPAKLGKRTGLGHTAGEPKRVMRGPLLQFLSDQLFAALFSKFPVN